MNYALIFPGQGSQSVKMLSELGNNFPIVKETFFEASEILNFDVWRLTQTDSEKLNQTTNTQVAMLCAGISCFKVLEQECSLMPSALAGHSLGEICAVVASGSLSFADSVSIVQKRAVLMQNAVPMGVGSMAAILGLSDEKIIKICSNYNGEGMVEAVNFNAKGQVVIAGNTDAVNTICQTMKENGAKRTIVLPISVPSHSSMMTNAALEFSSFIADFEFKQPRVTVWHNIDAKPAENPEKIKQKLIKQLYHPVLWHKLIHNLKIEATIELGPNKVLSGLNRRINKNIISHTVFDNTTLQTTKEYLNG